MSLNILLVDDEPDIRTIVRLTLEKDGCTVVESDTARNIVTLATEQQPDVIILDVMMPGVSGFAALTALRGNAATRDIPIAMFSGLSDMATVERAIGHGASGYLTKPCSTEFLFQQVQTIMQYPLRPRTG